MQIRHKQNKKVLEAKSSKVALRKIAFEKSKQKIETLQAQLQELKSKSGSNEKAVVMRETYLERMDEVVYSKEDEVDGLKNVLKNKEDPSQIMEDEVCGPDVMEVRKCVEAHARCCVCPFLLFTTTLYLPFTSSVFSTSCRRPRFTNFVRRSRQWNER